MRFAPRRRWARNPDRGDRVMRDGLRVFLAGGAAHVPPQQLADVRDMANRVLMDRRLIPVLGGPLAPDGWIWVQLKNSLHHLVDQTPDEVIEAFENHREDPELTFGDPDDWHLVGPFRDYFLEYETLHLTGGLYFDAWVLVPAEPNWNRIGFHYDDIDTQCDEHHFMFMEPGQKCERCGAVLLSVDDDDQRANVMFPWRAK